MVCKTCDEHTAGQGESNRDSPAFEPVGKADGCEAEQNGEYRAESF